MTGADIKIDTPFLGLGSFTTPASTQDYTTNTGADYMAFAQLGSDNLRRGVTSRIYAQVINRGPADAAQPVKVRAFWASKGSSGYPALPANFWSSFPDSDPDTTDWKPFGAATTLAVLRAGEPQVVSWDYQMPAEAADTVAVLTCVTSPEDPVAEDSDPDKLDALKVATANKRVALREVGVNIQAAEIIIGILLLVGAAGAVAGAVIASKH